MTGTLLAAGLLLAAGGLAGTPAVAQASADERTELVDRLVSGGLTRAEMVGFYESLVQGEFEPPVCVEGDERFDDVPASNPFCAWIEELARRGITGGCTATNYCPGNPVTRSQMAAFILRATADEPFHLVGEPGEPVFGNGGEGDCLWQNPTILPGLGPVSFFKDSDGIVRLAGLPQAINPPGGGGICDFVGGDASDLVIFELPAGYHPEHLKVFPSSNSAAGGILIAPEGGFVLGGFFIPGGSVLVGTVTDGTATPLDGITFRAAAETTTSSVASEPANISLQALHDLMFD